VKRACCTRRRAAGWAPRSSTREQPRRELREGGRSVILDVPAARQRPGIVRWGSTVDPRAMEPLSLLKPLLELGKKTAGPFLFLASSCFVLVPVGWLDLIGVREIWTAHKGIIGTIWVCSGMWMIVHQAQTRLEKRAERKAEKKRCDEIVAEIKTLPGSQQNLLVKFVREGEGTIEIHRFLQMPEHQGGEALCARSLVRRLGEVSDLATVFRIEPTVRKAIESYAWEDTPVMLQVHPEATVRAVEMLIAEAEGQMADASPAERGFFAEMARIGREGAIQKLRKEKAKAEARARAEAGAATQPPGYPSTQPPG
jgi:hypothetical protein